MIYVIEVPHRGDPIVWRAKDQHNFVTTLQQHFQQRGDTPDGQNFRAWCEYLSSDLSQCYVLTEEEAEEYLRDQMFATTRSGVRVESMLQELLYENQSKIESAESDGDWEVEDVDGRCIGPEIIRYRTREQAEAAMMQMADNGVLPIERMRVTYYGPQERGD